MPALKPQSSVNKASYVAPGRRLSSGWAGSISVGRPYQRPLRELFSTSAKLYRHSVLGDREPKAHLLRKSAFGILAFRGQANVTWQRKATRNQQRGLVPTS